MKVTENERDWIWLARLVDNWDDEGAPAPSLAAIARARALYADALANGLPSGELDADVLGGVAVYWYGRALHGHNDAWLACMNSGRETLLVTTVDYRIVRVDLDAPDRWRRVVELLGLYEDGADTREAGW